MSYTTKYQLSYENVLNDLYRLDIKKKGKHTPIRVAGSVTHNYKRVDDIFEPIRGASLDIQLEASQTNLLNDFATFQEFDFQVEFFKNNELIFKGWINPDGYFQDWVNNVWVINLVAVDGLGSLKNLEFSDTPTPKEGFFNLIHTFSSGNTILTLEILGSQTWVALGVLENTFLKILTGVNIQTYKVTNVNNEFLTCEVIENPTAFFNGQFGCNIAYNIFTYKPREFNYLYAILERLGYTLPFTIADDINVDIGVPVDWTDVKKRILDKTVFENKNGNNLNCETVLIDILSKYNLTIRQENINGRLCWFICRIPILSYPVNGRRIREYNTSISNGEVILSQFNFVDGFPVSKTVVSDIDTLLKHDAIHCNENQQIRYLPALQNFRFETLWSGLRSFLGFIPDFWTELPPLPIEPNFGIFNGYMRFDQIITSSSSSLLTSPLFESIFIRPPSIIDGGIEIIFDWYVDYKFVNPAVQVPSPTTFRFILEYQTNTFQRYFNQSTGEWGSSPTFVTFQGTWPTPGAQPIGVVEGRFTLQAPQGGNDPTGLYKLIVYSSTGPNTAAHQCRLTNVEFLFDVVQFGIGKTHDSIQPELKSTFLKSPLKVINTNEPNAYFKNNLYRLATAPEVITGLVPMNAWKATGTPTYNDLLELTGRERIRIKQKPQKVFSGDIFGYIPYTSTVTYNGVNGVFMPTNYIHRTAEGIIELEAVELFNENIVINHEKKYIFEQESNVLIKEL